MPQPEKFTLRFYFQTLTRMLGNPRKFFSELPPEIGLKMPLSFLLLSSLIFAGAGAANKEFPNAFLMAGIFFVNAVGMAFIAALLGYWVLILTAGKGWTFTQFFSIYAFSSGVTLLVSWVPFFFWLTEPWKWWLIGTGMTRFCELKGRQATLIIGVTIGALVFFFWLILPAITPKRG